MSTSTVRPKADSLRGVLDPRRLIDGRVRVGFVIFGGMLALQSSQELDNAKYIYLVGTAIALLGSVRALWHRRAEPDLIAARPWLIASASLVALICLSFLVSMANGTPFTSWLRDAATYLLFATVPIFALDLAAAASRPFIVGMLVVAGFLGGLSWAVEWFGRRDIVDLPFSRVLFPSPQLPGMLFILAFATAVVARRGAAPWAIFAGIVLGLFLVTGTRSSLLLLAGPLTITLFAGRSRLIRAGLALLGQGAAAAAVVLAFQMTLSLTLAPPLSNPGPSGRPGPDASLGPGATAGAVPSVSPPAATPRPDIIGDRWASMIGLLDRPSSDGSFRERIAQYESAARHWRESPLLGKGPGLAIDWTDVSGLPRTGYTADTPLIFPAKFGIVGILVLLVIASAYWDILRRLRQRSRESVTFLTLVGYAGATAVAVPLGFVLEDKGTSFALIVVLALAFGELMPSIRAHAATDGLPPDPGD